MLHDESSISRRMTHEPLHGEALLQLNTDELFGSTMRDSLRQFEDRDLSPREVNLPLNDRINHSHHELF